MAQQYLLPCECGKANPVSVAQAGRKIPCSCGRDYVVPSLAGLRQLEPAVAGGSVKQPTGAGWSQLRGSLFVLGVLLALIGLPWGAYGYHYFGKFDVEKAKEIAESYESYDLDQIEKQSPVQLLATWRMIEGQGPGQAESSLSLMVLRERDFWFRITVSGFAVAAIGIVLAGGSLIGAQRRQT